MVTVKVRRWHQTLRNLSWYIYIYINIYMFGLFVGKWIQLRPDYVRHQTLCILMIYLLVMSSYQKVTVAVKHMMS